MIKPLLLAGLCIASPIVGAGGLLHHDADAPTLTVNEAFRLMPAERTGQQLRIRWEIAPGYYLYRERLAFEAVEPLGAKLATPQLSKGEKHHDEHFGDVHIYRKADASATFKLPRKMTVPTRIKVSYQGCADIGICYPPQTRILDIPQ